MYNNIFSVRRTIFLFTPLLDKLSSHNVELT